MPDIIVFKKLGGLQRHGVLIIPMGKTRDHGMVGCTMIADGKKSPLKNLLALAMPWLSHSLREKFHTFQFLRYISYNSNVNLE